jgi:pyridoxamine 5'-phosphate oxidase
VSIADLRREYAQAMLDEGSVDPDAIRQFEIWFAEARAAQLAAEPNAMTLATVTPDGLPAARIVLLKGVDPRGFTFFTDYRSAKGQDLTLHPHAALVFWWSELERQVRIAGTVSRLPREESEAYFRTRPLGSRLGAWTSHQSQVLPSRADLDARYMETCSHFAEGDIPLPPDWGGFVVSPTTIEFWQGRPSRLHDRVRYTRVSRRDASGAGWTIQRLSP